MGWLWPSTPEAQQQTQAPPAPSIPPATAPTLASTPSQAPPVPDRDADFYAAHPHLAPPTTSKTSSASNNPSETDRTLDPAYPTTMSCRAAFDSAFYCRTPGGMFNSIYRYGELQSCSEHWEDWMFCMRIKVRSKEAKEELVQERYREKERKQLAKPNSEDIWERR